MLLPFSGENTLTAETVECKVKAAKASEQVYEAEGLHLHLVCGGSSCNERIQISRHTALTKGMLVARQFRFYAAVIMYSN